MANLLSGVVTVLIMLWLVALVLNFGAPFIHGILVVAAILMVCRLFVRRRVII